jgi:hypothetical protein
MFEDRLRPRYLSRERRLTPSETRPCEATRSGESGRSPPATSPGQRKARAIVRKYRRNVRYAQLYRLKALVPAVAEREEATEVCTVFHPKVSHHKKYSTYLEYVPECLSPRPNWGPPTHSPAGEGGGGSQFRRLEKNPSILSTYSVGHTHVAGLCRG